MIVSHVDPPVPPTPNDRAFTQTVYLRSSDRVIGQAVWAATVPTQGIIQILELWIEPGLRRSGHGRRLMRAVVEQARLLHQLRGEPLRRLWIGVCHKTQVVGRSFLTSEGFHHIGSTCGLLNDEDLLVYVKSLD